ncbi:MAG: LysR family transcriptional regulator [Pseudomonadales bacterium]
MEIRQLRHLVAAIDEGTLILAADAVFITQPALTRSLQNLEHELGIELLQRLPRGVAPTAAGDLVYRHAKLILNEVNSIKTEAPLVAQGVTGKLTIGVGALFESYIVDDIVWQLATNHSELNMDIEIGLFEGLVEHLVDGNLDIVVSNLPSVDVPVSLVVEPLGVLTVVFVARHDHPLAQKDTCELKDLESARWAIMDQPHSYQMFKHLFNSEGIATPANLVRTNSLGLLISFLRKGGFVSVLPKHLLKDSFETEGLVELNIQAPAITRRIGLIYREDIAGRPLLETFCSAMRQAYALNESGSL